MAEFNDVRYDARVRKQAFSLAKNGYYVVLLMFNSSLHKKKIYKQANIEYHEYQFRSYKNKSTKKAKITRFLQAVFFILKINSYIVTHRADFYHAHNLKFLIASIMSAKLHQSKVVYDAHELHSAKHAPINIKNRFINRFNLIYEKMCLKSVDLFIQASIERAQYVAEKYRIQEPKVIENHINYISISDEKKDVRQKLKLNNNLKYIIYVGVIRLRSNRRLEAIIDALNLLPKDIHFLLLGPASDKDKSYVSNYALNNNVYERVHILDTVPYNEVVKIISSADISVIPLVADSENTRLSALNKISESCMAGLPIACSDYPNLKKIINENPIGKIGSVFNIDSAFEIAEAIRHCLIPENLAEYKKNCLRLAKTYLNWENEEAILIKLYNSL